MTAVTKHMFALSGTDLASSLQDDAWHAELGSWGVDRVQVNLDDAPVAEAMRLPRSSPPISALVSVWGPAPGSPELAGVVALLDEVVTAAAGALRGWQVDERRPIAPEEAWDGTRAEALANIALLRRPDDLSHEEWLHRWLVDHTPVAIETQGTFGYVQNIVVAPVPGTGGSRDADPPVAALVEELFPMAAVTDMHAFYGTGGSDEELSARLTRMLASVARFGADRDLDLVPTSRYLYRTAQPPSTEE